MKRIKIEASLTYEEAEDIKRQCPYNVMINSDLTGLTVVGPEAKAEEAADWIRKQAKVKISLAKKKLQELKEIVTAKQDEVQTDKQVEVVQTKAEKRKTKRRADK